MPTSNASRHDGAAPASPARDRAALLVAISHQARVVDAARARLIVQDHSEFLLEEYERERRVFRHLGHQLSRTLRDASRGGAAVAVPTNVSAP